MNKHIVTRYTLRTPRVTRPVTLAIAADLHNGEYEDMLPALEEADAILVPGDLLNRHCLGWENALRFIQTMPAVCPVFYSLGNHERRYPDKERRQWLRKVRASNVTLLDNTTAVFGEIALGGLSSVDKHTEPNGRVLAELSAMPGFRLLMCHHPEYFKPYVAGFDIDLTVAGHAHGGQVQLFGHGLYAPGQGLFPHLTHGFYAGNRLLVSRGMTNSAELPRIGNPCELVLLTLEPEA